MIVVISEGAEGRDAVAFDVRHLTLALVLGTAFEPLMVGRTHRIPERQEFSARPRRPIILKFLSFQRKIKVMRRAREVDELTFNTKEIFF